MSKTFKIIQDPELRIPVAAPSNRSGDTINTIYENKLKGPSTAPQADKTVQAEASLIGPFPDTVINVVENYDWAISPKSEIVEQPYIYLTEFRINKSPLLAQMVYLVKTLTESTGGAIKSVTDRFGEWGEGNPVTGLLSGLVNEAGDGLDKGTDALVNYITTLETDAGAVSEELKGILLPYSGMYYKRRTGFQYKLPYFSNTMSERVANWQPNYPGESPITSLLQSGMDFVANHGSGTPILGAYGTPGIYIERSKYFSPSPGQEPLQFNFPLLNTLSKESMQRNFDLVWLLSFQNSSMRRNKVDVYPPCIYTAHIPGVRYMLYCNIQNLSIEYLGTRRRVSITHPVTESTLDVIVPEAYNLTFTINNLTAESGNLMLKSLTNV